MIAKYDKDKSNVKPAHRNGAYLVRASRSGYEIDSRTPEELFSGFLSDKVKVLIFIDPDALDVKDQREVLAYALAMEPDIRVGMTIHPEARLAEYADVIIPAFRHDVGEEFYRDLAKYDNSKRRVITPEMQRRLFNGKSIDGVVNAIRSEAGLEL